MAGTASDVFEPAIKHVDEPYVLGAREVDADLPIEVAARTVGAFVVRTPGAGKIGHIVISNGKGGTIEAHSSKRGVIRSTPANRRWDMGIIVPDVIAHDGVFGLQTAHAVSLLQTKNNLLADGEVGPATFKTLKIPVPAWAKTTISL